MLNGNRPVNSNIMKYNIKRDIRRLSVRLAVIEQKCDFIMSQLSSIKIGNDIDELIDRMHRHARSMRDDSKRAKP